MKNALQSRLVLSKNLAATGELLLGLVLLAGSATSSRAQGQIASGTLASSGTGPYTYSLTFSNAANATSPIGSVWYAWIPGQFYLPGVPTSALAPVGWTPTVFNNSIQFVANSPADDIAAGSSLSGFSYQATFTPAQLALAPNSGVSVAYGGGLFHDAGNTFTVQIEAVPEPSALALLSLGAAACALVRRHRS